MYEIGYRFRAKDVIVILSLPKDLQFRSSCNAFLDIKAAILNPLRDAGEKSEILRQA